MEVSNSMTITVGLAEAGFRDLPIEDHCKIASKFGFHYLELGIGEGFPGRLSGDISSSGVDELKKCVQDYNLKTPFVCLENDFTQGSEGELKEEVERVKREIELAKKLGATHVRLFSGFAPVKEVKGNRWNNMIKALREVASKCSELGMEIAIETHGRNEDEGKGFHSYHTTASDKDAIVKLLEETPTTVGINFDPGNLEPLGPLSPIDYLEVDIIRKRINYFHLKDSAQYADGSWTRVALGEGNIDFKALLRKADFDGVYLIEYPKTDDSIGGVCRGLNHLKSICDVKFE